MEAATVCFIVKDDNNRRITFKHSEIKEFFFLAKNDLCIAFIGNKCFRIKYEDDFSDGWLSWYYEDYVNYCKAYILNTEMVLLPYKTFLNLKSKKIEMLSYKNEDKFDVSGGNVILYEKNKMKLLKKEEIKIEDLNTIFKLSDEIDFIINWKTENAINDVKKALNGENVVVIIYSNGWEGIGGIPRQTIHVLNEAEEIWHIE